jgi:hypothetical protein
MDRACSRNGGKEECIYVITWKAREKRDHYENEDIGGWII